MQAESLGTVLMPFLTACPVFSPVRWNANDRMIQIIAGCVVSHKIQSFVLIVLFIAFLLVIELKGSDQISQFNSDNIHLFHSSNYKTTS